MLTGVSLLLLVIENQSYSANFHNRAFLTPMLATSQLCVLRGARCALYHNVVNIGEKCAIMEIAALALIFY